MITPADRTNLYGLALATLTTPYGTQAHDDAYDAFCEQARHLMTIKQRREWDRQSLKATDVEITVEACRILDPVLHAAIMPAADAAAELDAADAAADVERRHRAHEG